MANTVPIKTSDTLAVRLWSKVDRSSLNGCWMWTGFVDRDGYGKIRPGNYTRGCVGTHRVSWVLSNGEIPTGLFVCHHCDVPACVNPSHLFLGSCKDNLRDAVAKGRNPQAAKTHCIKGHPFTPTNIYRPPKMPRKRQCMTCKAMAQRRYVTRKDISDGMALEYLARCGVRVTS